jgi:hypothetical protein
LDESNTRAAEDAATGDLKNALVRFADRYADVTVHIKAESIKNFMWKFLQPGWLAVPMPLLARYDFEPRDGGGAMDAKEFWFLLSGAALSISA